MTVFKRNAALAGLLFFAAACGGGTGEAAPAADAGSAVAAEAPAADAAAPATSGTVHEVKMVTTQGGASGVYEPATITVKKGDVIRFVNDGGSAHNVSFPATENAGASNLPADSPYLTGNGETFDLQVTMDPGTYNYVCTPHLAMGMKGQIVVQ